MPPLQNPEALGKTRLISSEVLTEEGVHLVDRLGNLALLGVDLCEQQPSREVFRLAADSCFADDHRFHEATLIKIGRAQRQKRVRGRVFGEGHLK